MEDKEVFRALKSASMACGSVINWSTLAFSKRELIRARSLLHSWARTKAIKVKRASVVQSVLICCSIFVSKSQVGLLVAGAICPNTFQRASTNVGRIAYRSFVDAKLLATKHFDIKENW
jgi:hypothetical protein